MALTFGAAPLLSAAPWAWFHGELREIEKEKVSVLQELKELPSFPAITPHEHAGFHSGFVADANSARWVQVDLGQECVIDAVVLVPAILGGTEAYGFPPRFRLEASNDPLFAEPILLEDHTHTDVSQRMAPMHILGRGVRARYVRCTATHLAPQPRKDTRYIFCLGEMLVFSGGRNLALQAQVTAPKAIETPPTWMAANLVDGVTGLGPPVLPEDDPGNGWHSGIESQPDVLKWVQVDLGDMYPVQELRLVPAHPSDYPDRYGFGFPRRFKVELSDTADFATSRVVLNATEQDFPNPHDHVLALRTDGLPARYARVTATRLWERSADFVFALAELQVMANGQNLALGKSVTALDHTLTPSWGPDRLVDGKSSAGVLVNEEGWLRQLSERRQFMESLDLIETQRMSALAVAQQRVLWTAVLGTMGIAFLAWIWWQHTQRVRSREVEALRERIARDLHDEIGSHLGSIRLMSEMALREGQGSESRETLEDIHRLSREAAESMKGIVWLVREGEAPELSRLVEALRESASALLRGVDWTFSQESSLLRCTANLEFHRQVFLFFREAIHNVARHSYARHVEIAIGWEASRFHLSIRDDGVGFDPAMATGGSGLANLRYRCATLRGKLQLSSAPGQGTTVTLVLPLA